MTPSKSPTDSPTDSPTKKPTNSPTVGPIIDEDFESGMLTQSWVNGGKSDWNVTSDKSLSGSHSLRSGDLKGRLGKSSDVTLAVAVQSDMGAVVRFSYLSDVMELFDHFEFRVDGEVKLEVENPSSTWTVYEVEIPMGVNDISFHVISAESEQLFDRSANVGVFGTGVFYVDDLEVTSMTR